MTIKEKGIRREENGDGKWENNGFKRKRYKTKMMKKKGRKDVCFI